jgi:hypothetical protein
MSGICEGAARHPSCFLIFLSILADFLVTEKAARAPGGPRQTRDLCYSIGGASE